MWQVFGQSTAVSLLKRSLEIGSLANAYLVVGPEHVGKMALALTLTEALNCESAEPPCGKCSSCLKIAAGKHADVQVIGLSVDTGEKQRAEISIEVIRQLQHSASLPPFEGRNRVFIIDGAEMLSMEAANCLLKTLEEPADRVYFVLLTTNERLLLPTVVSRCQRLELLPLSPADMETALTKNWNVDPQRAKLLARLSRGCLGWAVRALESDALEKRAECLEEILSVMEGDGEVRFSYAARLAAQFGENRRNVLERLDLWLEWWRDLLLIKTGSPDAVTNIDRLGKLKEMSGKYSLLQIREFIQDVRSAAGQLKLNANPRLALEVLMLDIPAVPDSVSIR